MAIFVGLLPIGASRATPMRTISILACLLCLATTGMAQTFSNTTQAPCDTWNSANMYTGFTRNINVTGLPTPLGASGTVLRQVNIQLGTSACTGNLSSYFARLVSPAGTIIQLFGPFTTSGTSMWMNIKLRDDPALERVRDYQTTTQQAYWPWNVGYYRTDVAGAFATVNGENPNGNWTLQIAENTITEVSFERVDLVFGPPIVVNDVTGTSTNNACAGATCVDGFAVVRGTNNAFSQLDPLYPGDAVGGCAWNGANNNSGWYRFIASGTTAYITVSGMANTTGTASADMQLVVVRATNPICSGLPSVVPPGGCPDPPTTGNNNTSYATPNGGVGTVGNIYLNGITANSEFNLSGLTAGQSYYLIIDGNGGASSTFYIEMPSGGTDCSILLPVTWTAFDVQCMGGDRRVYWTVATQVDNDRFEVERSTDGYSWSTIATVPGAGNTQQAMSYEVIDNVTELNEVPAILYYRVRQVDMDGQASYSGVESSSCEVIIYPNPAADHVTVVLPYPGAEVQLIDARGRIVRSARSSGSMVRMDVADLATGYYCLRMVDSGLVLSSGVLMKM